MNRRSRLRAASGRRNFVRQRVREYGLGLAAAALSLALALAATWPLPCHLTHALPLGRQTAATVPLFNTWTLWWNCDRLQHAYAGYWDAPIFHPATGALAYSEPLPWTAAGLPVLTLGGRPELAYNLLLLAALTLNGWMGCQLFRRLGYGIATALAGAALLTMLPFVHNELGVIQLVPLVGLLWTIDRLRAFSHQPTIVTATLIGLAVTLTSYLCLYYALFAALIFPPATLVLLGRQVFCVRVGLKIALAIALAGLLVAPLAIGRQQAIGGYRMQRPQALLQQLAARPVDYTAEPWPMRSGLSLTSGSPREHIRLSPGAALSLLATIGLVVGLCQPGTRRWSAFCAVLLVGGLLLSLGANVVLGNWSPYGTLLQVVPGLDSARNIYRFAVFVQLAIVMLSVQALHWLSALPRVIARLCQRTHAEPVARRWTAPAGAALALVLGAAAVVEIWPPPQTLFACPPRSEQDGWTEWLQAETPRSTVLACLPFPRGKRAADYETTALWMYLQSRHERPLVNGYSGFFPTSFLDLKQQLQGFPDAASLHAMHARGVQYCVIRHDEATADLQDATSAYDVTLQYVLHDAKAGVDVYRLVASSSSDHTAPPRSQPALP